MHINLAELRNVYEMYAPAAHLVQLALPWPPIEASKCLEQVFDLRWGEPVREVIRIGLVIEPALLQRGQNGQLDVLS